MSSYCVYVISLNKSPVYYIGSTGKIRNRLENHKSCLRTGKHRNVKLQNAWKESCSDEFHVKGFIVKTRKEALGLEETMIRENENDPNMANISLGGIGGDNLSRNPRYAEICKQKSIKSSCYWDSMDKEQRAAVRNLKGEKNPMYGRNHTEETRKKISERKTGISHGVGRKLSPSHVMKISEKAKLRTGDKNPFFGRKHNHETRRIISEKNKGTPSPTRKTIRIDGVVYDSYTEAATALGISNALITHRVKSNNPKYDNYETVGLTSKLNELI